MSDQGLNSGLPDWLTMSGLAPSNEAGSAVKPEPDREIQKVLDALEWEKQQLQNRDYINVRKGVLAMGTDPTGLSDEEAVRVFEELVWKTKQEGRISEINFDNLPDLPVPPAPVPEEVVIEEVPVSPLPELNWELPSLVEDKEISATTPVEVEEVPVFEKKGFLTAQEALNWVEIQKKREHYSELRRAAYALGKNPNGPTRREIFNFLLSSLGRMQPDQITTIDPDHLPDFPKESPKEKKESVVKEQPKVAPVKEPQKVEPEAKKVTPTEVKVTTADVKNTNRNTWIIIGVIALVILCMVAVFCFGWAAHMIYIGQSLF